MKTIKLLRDHHVGNVMFSAGEIISVDFETYDFLMKYYKELRLQESAAELDAKQKLENPVELLKEQTKKSKKETK